MNYYYLLSSLPTLNLDEAPSISFDEFIEICEDHLVKRDMEAIRAIIDEEEAISNHSAVTSWKKQEILLKNTIARLRASKLNADVSLSIRETEHSDTYTELATSDAFSRKSPLDRERMLDKYRWDMAEELAGVDPFSSNAILAYTIKLKLSERWATFDEEKALESARSIINRNPQDEVDDNSQEIK